MVIPQGFILAGDPWGNLRIDCAACDWYACWRVLDLIATVGICQGHRQDCAGEHYDPSRESFWDWEVRG